jgi:hypothetical protein
MIVRKCGVRFVEPGAQCPGHLGKFDDCAAQALFQLSLDWADASTGSSDFEGHVELLIVEADDADVRLDEGIVHQRTVVIRPGNYLIFTAADGQVTVATVSDTRGAWAIFGVTEQRYNLWEAGCNPNDPEGHLACDDTCLNPGWVDA